MEEMGLAQSIGKQTQPMRDLEQVIAMLLQGMLPEELIAKGVPEQLVMAAMQEISKQTTQVPNDQAGLAASVVRPERGM